MEETAQQAIEKLIQFVESASPVIWQALITKVYVDALNTGIWIVFGWAAMGVLLWFRGLAWKHSQVPRDPDEYHYDLDSQTGWQVAHWLTVFTMVMIVVLIIGGIVFAVERLLNPNYYAILSAIELFKQ